VSDLLGALVFFSLGVGFLALAKVAWKYVPRLMDSTYPGQSTWVIYLNKAVAAGIAVFAGVASITTAVRLVVELASR
jgi:hypothetical protein